VELGYDYCLKEECQQRCLQPVRLAAVGVNKAADYYYRADEVLPPPLPTATPVGQEDLAEVDDSRPRPASGTERRPKTTLERLQEQQAALDEALAESYERFGRGEITATEMDHERNRLIDAFNRQVRGENIRYRSLLRRRSNKTG
jgi:hypothetical protein